MNNMFWESRNDSEWWVNESPPQKKDLTTVINFTFFGPLLNMKFQEQIGCPGRGCGNCKFSPHPSIHLDSLQFPDILITKLEHLR